MRGFGQNDVQMVPLHMAMVAATVANDGVWMQPHLVREIVDGDGAREAFEPVARTVLSPETAATMRELLAGVVERGTGSAAAVDGYAAAARLAPLWPAAHNGLGVALQEAGRAGRDGKESRCVLLYDPADADSGPNALMNYPELSSALNQCGAGVTTVTGATASANTPTIRLFPTTVVEDLKQTGNVARDMETGLQEIIGRLDQQQQSRRQRENDLGREGGQQH